MPPTLGVKPAIFSNVRLRAFQSSMLSGDTKPRGVVALRFPDRDEPIGLAVRQRPQQRGIDEREDRAVGADAERQRQ